MKRPLIAAALFAALLLIPACTQQQATDLNNANIEFGSPEYLCVKECEKALIAGTDLSAGPCLGEIVDDWVCDVAHSPRQPADDLEENQCGTFISGHDRHFVEISPKCEPIRKY